MAKKIFVFCMTALNFFIPVWGSIYLEGDYLYWKARTDSIPYATGGIDTTTFDIQHEFDFSYNSGFKVGGGFIFDNCGDCWDLSLIYTNYFSKATGSVVDDTGATEFPWTNFGNLGTRASADWHLKFQVLDLMASTKCWFRKIILSPAFGIKGAYTKEELNAFYIDNGGTPESSFNRQRYWAVGPELGFNAGCPLWGNFDLIFETASTLLWGKYNVRKINQSPPNFFTNLVNTGHKFENLKLVLQYLIGLSWKQCLCNSYYTQFFLGWEEQIWFDHNQFLDGSGNFNPSYNRNTNLNLYGLTFKAQFGF